MGCQYGLFVVLFSAILRLLSRHDKQIAEFLRGNFRATRDDVLCRGRISGAISTMTKDDIGNGTPLLTFAASREYCTFADQFRLDMLAARLCKFCSFCVRGSEPENAIPHTGIKPAWGIAAFMRQYNKLNISIHPPTTGGDKEIISDPAPDFESKKFAESLDFLVGIKHNI